MTYSEYIQTVWRLWETTGFAGRDWASRMIFILVGEGARGSEVGKELETQTDDKVPDVSGHLRTSDKHTPNKDQQDGVKCVTDIPQSERKTREKQ